MPDRIPAPVPPAAPAKVHEAAMEAYFREYRIAGGNPDVSRRALEAMVNTAWAAGREPAADAILKREYDRGVAAGRTAAAAALRDMADRIDRGPAIPLPPSVYSALIRERAADIAEGTDHAG